MLDPRHARSTYVLLLLSLSRSLSHTHTLVHSSGGEKLLEVCVVNGVGDGDDGGKLLNEGKPALI